MLDQVLIYNNIMTYFLSQGSINDNFMIYLFNLIRKAFYQKSLISETLFPPFKHTNRARFNLSKVFYAIDAKNKCHSNC